MKFIANENFPIPAFHYLLDKSIDIIHIGNEFPGISDQEVLKLAMKLERIIITFDSDYGEIIFKNNIIPPQGVIYLRLRSYQPVDPGKLIFKIITNSKISFTSKITVIDKNSIRQKSYG